MPSSYIFINLATLLTLYLCVNIKEFWYSFNKIIEHTDDSYSYFN